tara:strand:- start:1144 stop:2109 length:966 start_codon:yes stop_codon:yes gene_type:complete
MHEMYKINGDPGQFADLDVFHKLSQQFLPFAHKRLGFDKPVDINLLSDPNNAKNPLGKTAYYNPEKLEITVFVDKRHVKDILRSMSHELVHHTQNCRGEFDNHVHTGPGYAQEDGHMREMEKEAYLEGQMLLRDWEDSTKLQLQKENKAMENKFDNLEEGDDHPGSCQEAHGSDPSAAGHKKYMQELRKKKMEEEQDPIGGTKRFGTERSAETRKMWKIDGKTVICTDGCTKKEAEARVKKDKARHGQVKESDENQGGAVVDDTDTSKGMTFDTDEAGKEKKKEKEKEKEKEDKYAVKNENWTRKNKDQLLFERLVKKWAK